MALLAEDPTEHNGCASAHLRGSGTDASRIGESNRGGGYGSVRPCQNNNNNNNNNNNKDDNTSRISDDGESKWETETDSLQMPELPATVREAPDDDDGSSRPNRSNKNIGAAASGIAGGFLSRRGSQTNAVFSQPPTPTRHRSGITFRVALFLVVRVFVCAGLVVSGVVVSRAPTPPETLLSSAETKALRPRSAEVFFFDTLFGGVKKRPSRESLERPPPLARSILLVLRAETTPVNPIVDDLDRQITAKGMRDAEGLGVYLSQHKIPEPDWIFCSPTERTAKTTELVRRHWAATTPVAFEDILYTLEFNDYFSFVAGLNDHFRRVMIVGHNPAILQTAQKLMKTHGIEDFPTSGLMEIRWDDLAHWRDVAPYSGNSKMAIDPNNNFFFSSAPG